MVTNLDGSLDEFAGLIRAHQAGVRAYISSLGVPFDLVDDIAQESFLIAWRKRDSFDAGRDFGNWVRGIARNVVLRARAADQRSPKAGSVETAEVLAAQAGAGEAGRTEEMQQLVTALHECVKKLPPRSGALLLERYEKNVKASDLARRLGGSPDAMRQAFVRIRQQLRECIQEQVGEVVL